MLVDPEPILLKTARIFLYFPPPSPSPLPPLSTIKTQKLHKKKMGKKKAVVGKKAAKPKPGIPAKKVTTTGMRKKSTRLAKSEPETIYPKLDVRDVYIRNCTALGIRPNVAMIANLPPPGENTFEEMTVLRANNVYIGDKGAVAAFELIRVCPNITELHASSNGITDDGATTLLGYAKDHPSLTHIDLSHNKLSQDIIPVIKRMLRSNKTVKTISLEHNANIYESSMNELKVLLAFNQSVQNADEKILRNVSALRKIVERFSGTPNDDYQERKAGLDEWIAGRELCSIPARDSDGWATVSVFISATFSDFHSEVHIISHRVVDDLNSYLRKFKIKLLPMDLHQCRKYSCDNIENISNVKYCLSTLRSSSDILLSLHGDVLSWVPVVDEIPNYQRFEAIKKICATEPTSLSYLSFTDAFQNKVTEEKVPMCFFYFRNPEVIEGIPLSLKSLYTEKGHRKCWNHREQTRIQENTPEALQYRDYGAHFKTIDVYGQIHLCRCQAFEEAVQADVFNALEKMYNFGELQKQESERLAALVNGTTPPPTSTTPRVAIANTDYRTSLSTYFAPSRESFVGREPSIAKVKSIIKDNPPDTRIVSVCGAAGSGKTALFAQILHEIEQEDTEGEHIVLKYFAETAHLLPDTSDIRTLTTSLYYQTLAGGLAKPYQYEDDLVRNDRIFDTITHLWEHLSCLAREKQKCVNIFIEGADAVTGLHRASELFVTSAGEPRIPWNVRVFITAPNFDMAQTGGPTQTYMDTLFHAFPQMVVLRIERLLLKERRALISSWLEPYGVELESADENELVKHAAAVHPQYCKLMCNEVLHRSQYMSVGKMFKSLGGSVSELIYKMFEARQAKEQNHGGALYFRRFGAVLASVRDGLTVHECREVLMSTFEYLQPHSRNPSGSLEENFTRCFTSPADSAGYDSDTALAATHSKETRLVRKRLWGRWSGTPRLLPGAIWSRLIFEFRPFILKKVVKQRGDTETYVVALSGRSVSDAASAFFIGPDKRRAARIHAQLGHYYRGKLYIPHTLIWRRALRGVLYHLSKAWLWESVCEVLRPSFLYHVLAEGLSYEVARDLEVTEAELRSCLNAYTESLDMQTKLRTYLQRFTEYRLFLKTYCRGQHNMPIHASLLAMLATPQTWRLSQQAAALFAHHRTSFLQPHGAAFAAARGVMQTGLPSERISDTSLASLIPQERPRLVVSTTLMVTFMGPAADVSNAETCNTEGASYNSKGVVYVWDHSGVLQSRIMHKELSGAVVCDVTIAKDETQLLIASDNWRLLLWDLETQSVLASLPLPSRGSATVRGCCFSNEPRAKPFSNEVPRKGLCFYDSVGRLLLWSSYDAHAVPARQSSNGVMIVAFSPGGVKMVAGFEDSSIIAFSLAGKAPVQLASYVAREQPKAVRFLDGSSSNVLTLTERKIVVWHADTGAALCHVELTFSFRGDASLLYCEGGIVVSIDPGVGVAHWQVKEEAGAVSLDVLGSVPVALWDKDAQHGPSSWASDGKVCVGAFASGVVSFVELGGQAPSLAQCFMTDAVLAQEGAPTTPPCLLPLCSAMLLPSKEGTPPSFAFVDASSGVPLIVSHIQHEFAHGKLPITNALD